MKLVKGDDPFFAMTTSPYEDQIIDLWALQFMFAVEAVDPRLGRIEVMQNYNGVGMDRIKKPIDMVDCDQLF